MYVGIVTDTSSDLPAHVFENDLVSVVPLDVRLGDNDPEAIRALAPEEFWQLARQSHELPTTAAPSPGAFQETFDRLRDGGADAVICITISSALSATYQSAIVASQDYDIPILVVDSHQATMGQGLLVLDAIQQRQHCDDVFELEASILDARGHIATFGTLDTLDNLKRGGRIGAAQAFFGSMLSIKPTVEIKDGRVEGLGRQRTRRRALADLASRVRRAGPLVRFSVVHALADDIEEFLDLVRDVDAREPLIVSVMGPVIGAHTGIGTIGVAYQTVGPFPSTQIKG